MRKLLPALLFCLALAASDKPKTPRRLFVSGTLVSKGTLADLLTLEIKDPAKDAAYKCIIETRDFRFRDYAVGDEMMVVGSPVSDTRFLKRCEVRSWTQRESK